MPSLLTVVACLPFEARSGCPRARGSRIWQSQAHGVLKLMAALTPYHHRSHHVRSRAAGSDWPLPPRRWICRLGHQAEGVAAAPFDVAEAMPSGNGMRRHRGEAGRFPLPANSKRRGECGSRER